MSQRDANPPSYPDEIACRQCWIREVEIRDVLLRYKQKLEKDEITIEQKDRFVRELAFIVTDIVSINRISEEIGLSDPPLTLRTFETIPNQLRSIWPRHCRRE